MQAAYADASKAQSVLGRVANHTVAQAVADGRRFQNK